MSSEHIEENLLERYAMGGLAEQPAARVDEHLLACRECQARLVQLDTFLGAVKPAVLELAAQPIAARKREHILPRWAWLGCATAVAACMLLVIAKPGAKPVAPAIIQMRAFRGPDRAARLEAGRPAVLVFDVAGQSRPTKYEIEVVDSSGKPVWTGKTEAKADSLSVEIRKLDPGRYWVRVYREQPEKGLLVEYALRVAPSSEFKR